MKKRHQGRVILAALSLLAIVLFCAATDGSESQTPTSSNTAVEGNTKGGLTEEQINSKLSWLEKEGNNPRKAKELKELREKEPEKFETELKKAVFREKVKQAIFETAFFTIGGLGLFLFGMGLMSDGLKKVAGRKLRKIVESMTKRPFIAFLVGAGVTALVQSSSATTVMIIGFVNAALLTLKQAICVIIGTNVGTTVTAWLVSISGIGALKITLYALPAVGIGFFMRTVGKTRKTKSTGQILLGFGILFVGIGFMKQGFEPLEESQEVKALFIALSEWPLLAILAGTVLTLLLQSSSAAVAIVQLLAMEGAFGDNWEAVLNVSIPFVLGSNIGTTITAQLAAIQANLNAKRAAWAHTIFNILGVVIAYPFVHLGWFSALVGIISPWELGAGTIAAHIAVAHTIFNVGNSVIFLPMSGLLAKLVVKLVPERAGDLAAKPVVLEEHLLDTPIIALEQAKREIIRMARTAKTALENSIDGIVNDDRKKLESTRQIEDYLDEFQYEITSYLSVLSRRQLSYEVSVELPVLLHTVNDLERIGDHAVNIVEIAERKIEQKLSFSDSAVGEADRLRKEAEQMLDNVIAALENNDVEASRAALVNEGNLNKMQMDFRHSHVQRMSDGVCSAEAGLIFIDLVDNVEKIGDHLTNIAQAVIGGLQWDGIELEKPPIL
ncbi:MAG TPA: Na/Pi cotransporter family protein [Planctomycetes bacterium]|nr:Na/Pi cotransporter family protein [Planctomycetota bacterium]